MCADNLSSNETQSLREHLLALLDGANAHLSFDDFVVRFPATSCGRKVESLPYTAWQVLEHMRIAQWDILEFCRDAKHVSPRWPEGYWPKAEQLGDARQWQESVEKLRTDLRQIKDLVSDHATDLFAKIPHGSGQTILREALLVADHNSYHLGVLVALERLLQTKY